MALCVPPTFRCIRHYSHVSSRAVNVLILPVYEIRVRWWAAYWRTLFASKKRKLEAKQEFLNSLCPIGEDPTTFWVGVKNWAGEHRALSLGPRWAKLVVRPRGEWLKHRSVKERAAQTNAYDHIITTKLGIADGSLSAIEVRS